MALFQYEAVTEKGKKIIGAIDADNLHEARLKLLKRQVATIRIDPVSEKKIRIQLNKKELLVLTKELTRLLQASLPLFEAISALEEKYRGLKAHLLLLDLSDKVRSGLSFSHALSQHKDTFDILYITMVANAEKTGTMAGALEEIGNLLSKQISIRKQIISALLYPAMLGCFCLVVLASLLFYVVPSLKELFDERNLHPFTRIVFGVSDMVCSAKTALLLLMIGIGSLGAVFKFYTPWKGKVYGWFVTLPGLRPLFAKIAFARFCRAAATLLEGGLPALSAFSQARYVMRHPPLEQIIASAQERISQGEPLHVPFQNQPWIPPLVPRMLALAQQGGRLPFMMQQIALIYEEELEGLLTHFASLAQPILLLILGGIVGFVLLSVLLPLTDVTSFVM